MDAIRFERIEECVDVRIDALKEALRPHPVKFIECSCIDNGHASLAVLEPSSFLEACLALMPAVVFIYREVSLLDDQIAATMSDISDDPIEQNKLKKEFLSREAALMRDARKSCPEYGRSQCFFSAGVTLVLMGCEVVAYLEFMDALYEFGSETDEARKTEENEQLLKIQVELQKIAEQVAEDEGFISLRGRRKRAMHVLQHYRDVIPEGYHVERPDPSSDLLDRNIVQVSRLAADIIEFGLFAPVPTR